MTIAIRELARESLRTVVAEEDALLGLPEGVVETPLDDVPYNGYTHVLVMEVHEDYVEINRNVALVGRVVRARRSDNEPEYFFAPSDSVGSVYYRSFRLRGAVLNLDPVVDTFYRELTGEKRLLRFTDQGVFAVVAGQDGQPWPIPNDVLAVTDATAYVEVEYEGADSNVQVDPGTQEFIEATEEFPMFGHAAAEELEGDGPKVLLNPPIIDGQLYIVWSRGARTYSYVALKLPGQDLRIVARLRGHNMVNTSYTGTVDSILPDANRIRRVRFNTAGMVVPKQDPSNFTRSIQRITTRMED